MLIHRLTIFSEAQQHLASMLLPVVSNETIASESRKGHWFDGIEGRPK